MAEIVPVDDPADERISDYVGLVDRDLRRLRARTRDVEGDFFIVEGAVPIRHLLESRFEVRSLLLTDRGLRSLAGDLAAVEAPAYVVSQPLIETIAGFHFHRGALASAGRRPALDVESVVAAADLIVVAEGVNDHENLGALFRNAAAFGAGGVLLDPTSADPLYRRSVRVSMGQVLRVPFARLPDWPGAIARLRADGFEVLALTPGPGAEDLEVVAALPWRRRALLVGAEGPGLSAAALAAADRRVRVRLAAGVDSLNVATAAAVALHRLWAGP